MIGFWIGNDLQKKIVQEILRFRFILPEHPEEIAQQPDTVPLIQLGKGTLISFRKQLHQFIIRPVAERRPEYHLLKFDYFHKNPEADF
jgi:hypothetical protein